MWDGFPSRERERKHIPRSVPQFRIPHSAFRIRKMIHIINTGVANIRSLQAAFDRLDQTWRLTTDADEIAEAKRVVLPGVGAFAAATRQLDELKIRQPLLERIGADRATLCICLGMQLLCAESEESPGAVGLGIVDQRVQRFGSNVHVPQLGWNTVQPQGATSPFEAGEAYFANSFRLVDPPAGWGHALTDYGGTFTSSLWRRRVLACQFHPELSGDWGQTVLQNWISNA